jgi:hypothetical protein
MASRTNRTGWTANIITLASLAAMVAVVVGVGGAGGCSLRRPVDLDLPVPADGWASRTAVDIRNYHGSVLVMVDERLTEAEVSAVAGAKPPIESAADSRATESVTVVADWVEQEGGRVLRVRTGSTWPRPEEVWVDIAVRMPSCQGATIWNRGGTVELIGVEGSLQVENGAFGSSDGTIRVRTDKPMTQPVSLTTDRGSVIYQVGPNSTGAFDLSSGTGRASFQTIVPPSGPSRADKGRAMAVINNGHNPVVLRSDAGTVRASVMADPMAYTNKWE